jgi:hypothetical protein
MNLIGKESSMSRSLMALFGLQVSLQVSLQLGLQFGLINFSEKIK